MPHYIVTDEMMDNAMEMLLEVFENDNSKWIKVDKSFFVKQNVCSPKEVNHLIGVLKAEKAIEEYQENGKTYIRLGVCGNRYFEKKAKQLESTQKETRRFWIGIIKDILIFVAGSLFTIFSKTIYLFLAGN